MPWTTRLWLVRQATCREEPPFSCVNLCVCLRVQFDGKASCWPVRNQCTILPSWKQPGSSSCDSEMSVLPNPFSFCLWYCCQPWYDLTDLTEYSGSRRHSISTPLNKVVSFCMWDHHIWSCSGMFLSATLFCFLLVLYLFLSDCLTCFLSYLFLWISEPDACFYSRRKHHSYQTARQTFLISHPQWPIHSHSCTGQGCEHVFPCTASLCRFCPLTSIANCLPSFCLDCEHRERQRESFSLMMAYLSSIKMVTFCSGTSISQEGSWQAG